ncbi:MAG: glutamate racemase, partial [Draconibacterium sp.]|nr:glutamate racemase [Draconibacterium sp.]
TVGTVVSESYPIELEKWSSGKVKSTVQEACPMWVSIVENNEIETEGAEFFIKKNIENILQKDEDLDTLILGCTHYPLLLKTIQKYVPEKIKILEQGQIVADKLVEYLQRHPEINDKLSKSGSVKLQTTESAENFENMASLFLGRKVKAQNIHF